VVPISFHDFFTASAGAGAALVGLLFVAISIAPERTVMRSAPLQRQVTASSTFTAMLNAFFISLVALVPGYNLAIIVLVMGSMAFVNSVTLGWYLLREQRRKIKPGSSTSLASVLLILAGLGLYGYELAQGFQLMLHPNDIALVKVVVGIIVAVYGLGLARAWELLGAQRYNLLARLSALRDLDLPENENLVRDTSIGIYRDGSQV
jgi:hypothetical protein